MTTEERPRARFHRITMTCEPFQHSWMAMPAYLLRTEACFGGQKLVKEQIIEPDQMRSHFDCIFDEMREQLRQAIIDERLATPPPSPQDDSTASAPSDEPAEPPAPHTVSEDAPTA